LTVGNWIVNRRENRFKRYLFNIMGQSWHVQSHEDKYSSGIPDLSFGISDEDGKKVNGWIELKQVDVGNKPRKFTSEQINWLKKRNRHGGNCFIMVRRHNTYYYIFDGSAGREVRDGVDYEGNCIHMWTDSIDPDELAQILLHGKLI